ncbi:hypothetical protein BDW74DRAFT_184310 [Aspergillus multicolor]|uniref:uncharacterized protein n=1 Tax=Aspergillus multicolor TaxID=41759 RepID=UPI003CCCC8C7
MFTAELSFRPRAQEDEDTPMIGADEPTNSTDVPTRPQLMRRHGLIVSNETPSMISILVDVPREGFPKQKNYILAAVQNMIEIVQTRLITKEFANPHALVHFKNSRVIITAFTESPTPFTVYRDVIHPSLVALRDNLARRDAMGEVLEMDENWVYFEGCIRMQWLDAGVSVEEYYNAPISDPQWREELGLGKIVRVVGQLD